MTNIRNKVAYVTSQGQSRRHACHWPGCTHQVPPALWGCKKHWYRIPAELRDRIWRSYRIGQEEDGNPSDEYIAAANAVQDWIKQNWDLGRDGLFPLGEA